MTANTNLGPCPRCVTSAETTARFTAKRQFIDCAGIEFTV